MSVGRWRWLVPVGAPAGGRGQRLAGVASHCRGQEVLNLQPQEPQDVSMKEVFGAVSRLKGGKASGVDEVKAEYLKSGGYVCAEWMVMLLNEE